MNRKPPSKSKGSKPGKDDGAPVRNRAERKKAPDARNKPALLLSQIVDFLPDPTFAIDTEGKIIIWNHAMEKLTGIEADSMVGKADHEYSVTLYGERRPVVIDFVLHSDREMEKRYTSLLRQGDSIFAESVVLPLKRHLWIKASPIYDGSGHVIGAIETLRDITENKLTEDALKKSETKYRDIFLNVSDFLYIHDLKGNFIETNMASKKGTGYTEIELTGLSIKDLLPERHRH